MLNITINEQIICRAIHADFLVDGSGDEFCFVGGDKLKRLYQDVVKSGGWSIIWIAELKDKRLSIDSDGPDASTLFFIQIADDQLPSRTYSTKGLSTPRIAGATLSAIIGTTPPDLFELLRAGGTAGVARRAILTYNPIHNEPILIAIRRYREEKRRRNNNHNNNNAMAYSVKYSFDIEVIRFYKLFVFCNYVGEDEEKSDSIFTKKHKVIKIECESNLIDIQLRYLSKFSHDKYLENFEQNMPNWMMDDDGNETENDNLSNDGGSKYELICMF